MANSKISALTAATTPLDGTEVLPIVQIADDGAGCAIKLTITYINNSGVVTGGGSWVTFVGQVF